MMFSAGARLLSFATHVVDGLARQGRVVLLGTAAAMLLGAAACSKRTASLWEPLPLGTSADLQAVCGAGGQA